MHFRRGAGRVVGKCEGLLLDVAQCSLVSRARKGGPSINHLVDKDTKSPPIDGVPVGPAGGHLRRHVLVGPDEGTRPGGDRFGDEKPVRSERLDFLGPEEAIGDAGEWGE